jgi:hypothetical protein
MRTGRVDANGANFRSGQTIVTGFVFGFPKIKVSEATGSVGYPHFVATNWKVHTCDEMF